MRPRSGLAAVAAGGRHVADVGATAELASGAGDDDRPVVDAAGDGADLGEKLVPHPPIDRVLALGAPERDRDDALEPFDGDRFEFAGFSGHAGRRY